MFCGSSGSQRVNAAVQSQLSLLREHFSIVHVRGKGNLDPALQDIPGYWQMEYLHDEMAGALWLADLVIGRAGATTLAELEALGKRAVLVPLPASVSRGDQLDNRPTHRTSIRRRASGPWSNATSATSPPLTWVRSPAR
ncbi:glycosyltransferase [Streptomyces atratus]|uniref:glycosyltransferase n=1 Tax=Streptomyces atratus TaxID=1893 RepID=UPI0037BC21A3